MTRFSTLQAAASAPPVQPPARNTLGDEIRQTVREATEAARLAAQDARQAADVAQQDAIDARGDATQPLQDVPPAPLPPPTPDNFSIRVGPDGLLIVQTNPDGTETATPWNADNVIPPQVPQILAIVAIGVVAVIMAFPIGRAIARFIDRRGHAPRVPEDVVRRLGSMEQSLDAIAIEVERMSEAHRFTTRLLTEHVSAPDFRAGASASAVPQGAARETAEVVHHRSDAIRG